MRKLLIGVVAITLMLIATGLASAEVDTDLDEYTVDATASISGATNPPQVVFGFVLTDEDPLKAGVQLWPVPGEGIEKKYKSLWKYAVVYDPNGIADIAEVYEKLKYPDGTYSSEVKMTKLTYLEAKAALDQALALGTISSTDYAKYELGLRTEKGTYLMFAVENQLSNCDLPGIYTVWFKPVDSQGGVTSGDSTVTFEYYKIAALELDFSAVDYGQINIGIEKIIGGDEDWSTPEKPTVKNQGNSPFVISVQATDLVEPVNNQKILASCLSVQLGIQHIWGLASPVILDQSPLLPCTPTQIDFDIKAPSGTAAGSYSGTIDILIAHEV